LAALLIVCLSVCGVAAFLGAVGAVRFHFAWQLALPL
jgi:hypothetical protein